MLSILIAAAIGAGIGSAVGIDLQSLPWGITCGIAGYVITQIIISLVLRKKINAVQVTVFDAADHGMPTASGSTVS